MPRRGGMVNGDKTVIMLELTSPWEENFGKRHKQKMRTG